MPLAAAAGTSHAHRAEGAHGEEATHEMTFEDQSRTRLNSSTPNFSVYVAHQAGHAYIREEVDGRAEAVKPSETRSR